MSARSRWEAMLSNGWQGAPLVDVGTSSLTGIRASALPAHFSAPGALVSPFHSTLPLAPQACQSLGSDFIRTGLLFPSLSPEDGRLRDSFGVEWLMQGGSFSPGGHPLRSATAGEIARYPRPRWDQALQQVGSDDCREALVMADAPCPGLADLCFLLRGNWEFIEDIASNPREAAALLDWSLECLGEAYTYLLTSLEQSPDVVLYCDDLGFRSSMFFSPLELHQQIFPRMRAFFRRLRELTPALLCFHSCGAIHPILPDLLDMKVDLLNLEPGARGMEVSRLREDLPTSLVLHGCTDLCALGAAVANRDRAELAGIVDELARSAPVLAAPADSMSSGAELAAAVRGAAFVHSLSEEDFARLRKLGPVREVIEAAMEQANACELPEMGPLKLFQA